MVRHVDRAAFCWLSVSLALGRSIFRGLENEWRLVRKCLDFSMNNSILSRHSK